MNLEEITPLILSFNEQANLRDTLNQLSWAHEIVVVDCFSDDDTVEIIQSFPNTRLVQRKFDSHTDQWDFGLTQVKTTWTLAMDADYRCTSELSVELQNLSPAKDAYRIGFHFAIFGKRLRTSMYPPRVSLFQTRKFQYVGDGHTQLLKIVDGKSVGALSSRFVHDDRKPINRWIQSQYKYADLELEKLTSTPFNELSWKDKIRCRIVFAPILTMFYCLIYKRLIFDGWAGIYYTLQRVIAEMILSLKLVDYKFRTVREDTR
jgi:glycosyltransferase involved in cell wall biosynthesis